MDKSGPYLLNTTNLGYTTATSTTFITSTTIRGIRDHIMVDESSWIGKEIGNYRLVREVDSGSFGTVYEGKHIIFEDEPAVALKVLHAPFRSPKEREQLIK